jgi:P27 family predicted phage terminase small subunit
VRGKRPFTESERELHGLPKRKRKSPKGIEQAASPTEAAGGPVAPASLSASAKRIWDEVIGMHGGKLGALDSHTLEAYCTVRASYENFTAILARQSNFYVTKTGLARPHPALKEQARALAVMRDLAVKLGLEDAHGRTVGGGGNEPVRITYDGTCPDEGEPWCEGLGRCNGCPSKAKEIDTDGGEWPSLRGPSWPDDWPRNLSPAALKRWLRENWCGAVLVPGGYSTDGECPDQNEAWCAGQEWSRKKAGCKGCPSKLLKPSRKGQPWIGFRHSRSWQHEFPLNGIDDEARRYMAAHPGCYSKHVEKWFADALAAFSKDGAR